MTAVVDEAVEAFDFGPEPTPEYPSPLGLPTMVAPGVARLTEYIPYAPRPKQRVSLCLRCLESFFGGAARGGKSDALLMGALQFVDVPKFSALILRKTLEDLKLPGALMHRSHLWLDDSDARWSAQDKAWIFPSGAQLTFAYCQTDADVMRYKSAEFQYIAIDETTQWSEFAYRFLFSRLTKPDRSAEGLLPSLRDGLTIADVPMRMRSGSNPGDVGHAWVKRRLVDAETRRGPFIPSRVQDLEGIVNVDAYLRNLREMDPVNYLRFAQGDWEVRDPGEIFDVQKIEVVNEPLSADSRKVLRVRFWDMAGTEVKAGNDPDWCVGFRLALERATGKFRIEHVALTRSEPDRVEQLMVQTAELDGRDVMVRVEQEPGSEGKAYCDYLRRQVFRGFNFDGARSTGPKEQRIRVLQPIVNRGDVSIVTSGPWSQQVLDQIDAWPNVDHDDIVDAFAGAHRWLTQPGGRVLV